MGLFDLFSRKKPQILSFESDAESYSFEEIFNWMKKVEGDPSLFPPVQDDSYIAEIIYRLGNEKGIQILQEGVDKEKAIRNIAFAIDRNGSQDMVSIQYALYDPYVVYVTTGIFPFAGDSLTFNNYSQSIIREFPCLQIGADDTFYYNEFPGMGRAYQDAYAARTIVPLLGSNNDYKNVLEILKCMPIYGYDLRDGYHSNNIQPYANSEGINIQLAKIINILTSKLMPNEISSVNAIWGNNENIGDSISCSNKYVKSMTPHWFNNGNDYGGEVEILDSHIIISCPSNYKNLWSVFSINKYKKGSDDQIQGLIHYLGKFNFPLNKSFLGILQAFPIDMDEDSITCIHSMTAVIPNRVNAKVFAWQLAKFIDFQKKDWAIEDHI